MNEDLVPRDVVTAIVTAIVHSRSILLTFKFHSRDVINQVETVLHHITGSESHGNVVTCTPDLSWPCLSSKISEFASSGILLRKVDKLNTDVQLHLGYALMQRPNESPSTVVICTTVHPPERLHPILRKTILLRQDIDASTENLALMEMPATVPEITREKTMMRIREQVPLVTIIPELQRYMEDIILYIRAHRLVRGGLTPQAARDFDLVVRTLCVLHEQRFATPVIVKRAARVVLPTKLRFVSPEDEPSLQYGGDLDAVKIWMRQWDGDVLVESVLEEVPVPA